VAKLADAGGLNPPSIHVEYGFKSRPGHDCAGVLQPRRFEHTRETPASAPKRAAGSALGHVQMQALTPLQIETFSSELLNHGRADGTGYLAVSILTTRTLSSRKLASVLKGR
jgi:hypothetical protein